MKCFGMQRIDAYKNNKKSPLGVKGALRNEVKNLFFYKLNISHYANLIA